MSGSRTLKGKVAAVAVGLVFTVFVAEGVLRVGEFLADILPKQVVALFPPILNSPYTEYWEYSEKYHHDLIPNQDGVVAWLDYRTRLITNSLGFKDSEVRDVPLKSNGARILFIGDSITEGVGLPYEKTFVGMIGKSLAPRGVDVLNAGVFRYSPSIYHKKIQYLIEDVGLEFSQVVVFIDVSDAPNENDYFLDKDGNVRDSDYEKQRIRHILKSNVLLIKLADVILDTLRYDKQTAEMKTILRGGMGDHLSSWTYDQEKFEKYAKAGLEKASRHMDALAKLLSDKGVGLTVAVYPWPNQILHKDLKSRQVTHWRDWAAQSGAGFMNLFPLFINSEEPEKVIDRYYLKHDVHFNEEGSALVAAAFLKKFKFPAAK